jgi:hypothetical protein
LGFWIGFGWITLKSKKIPKIQTQKKSINPKFKAKKYPKIQTRAD